MVEPSASASSIEWVVSTGVRPCRRSWIIFQTKLRRRSQAGVSSGGAAARVHAGRGLIEEDDLGLADVRHRDGEAALHAARVRAGGLIGNRQEANVFENLGDLGRELSG
eukprot:6523533-Prymnesium_polylepis.6